MSIQHVAAGAMVDERARAELLSIFRVEMAEHCETLNRTFLSLEKEPPAAEQQALLDEAFRAAHSLKGAARAVALTSIEVLAHELEGVLGAVKRNTTLLSPPVFDLLYETVDTLAQPSAESGSTEEQRALCARLAAVHTGAAADGSTAVTVAEPVQPVPEAPPTPPVPSVVPPPTSPAVQRAPAAGGSDTVRLPAARLDRLLDRLGELVIPRLEIDDALARLGALRGEMDARQREWRALRAGIRRLERERGVPALRPLAQSLERNAESLTAALDELAALQARLGQPTAQLSVLTSDLQDEVKRLRMLPFGTLVDMLERSARDLARDLGKEVHFTSSGMDTELDRRLIDEIKDPLFHLVRNAVDHGIEPPAQRRAAGKPAAGSLHVAASQRGGSIEIEMTDDGGGIDTQALREVVGERGLVPREELAAMRERELMRLIFLPGISTRAGVSEVSGRGVGMDVVERKVSQLEGSIAVESTPGRGTSFTILLPLTLASTRAVLVQAGEIECALPSSYVERILTLDEAGTIGGRPAIECDDEIVLVAELSQLLGGGPPARTPGTVMHTAIVRAGTQRAALIVDRVLGEQEIIVKPLGFPLLRVRHVAGATILGAGRLVPILNVGDLVRATNSSGPQRPAGPVSEPERRRRRVLIADDSLTTRTLERHILEAAGYEVELAGDGAQALAKLQEGDYDLLVSDVQMPVLDGFGLTERLRMDPRLRDLHVVLVTSLDSTEDRERGLHAGADAYVVKSAFDQDHLLRTIREMLQ